MAVLGLFRTVAFAGTISGFMIRNEPQFNLTATIATTWTSKVHGESSADGSETRSTGSNSRVRMEATASDFALRVPTTSTVSITIIDIGTIIQTLIPSSVWAIPTVHFEDSASGWDDATSTVHFESSATDFGGPTSEAAHGESSATGWDQTGHQDLLSPSTRYKTVEMTDDLWTKNLRPSTTVGPATSQITNVPRKTVIDYPLPPAITHDGVVVRPIVVTRSLIVTLPDDVVTTTEDVVLQVAVGSSTLSLGIPITVDNVVFDIATDTAGSTILHAGDLMTTLPQPAAGQVRTFAGDQPETPIIATTVVNGTTKYILAGQTLAPGQPVTIGGTPISMTTSGGDMVLYVGDKTTTISAAGDVNAVTGWATISASIRETVASTESAIFIPTSKKSGSSAAKVPGLALVHFSLTITIFAFLVPI